MDDFLIAVTIALVLILMDAADKWWTATSSSEQNALGEDAFEIENIAVGPYCVIDTFHHPHVAPTESTDPYQGRPKNTGKGMDEPVVTSADQYGSTQAPWISEDMTSTAWDSWMQWDGSDPSVPMKTFNPQASYSAPLEPTTQPQSSQGFSGDTPNMLPTTTSGSITYFGQPLRSPHQFEFQASSSAPNVSAGATIGASLPRDPTWPSDERLNGSVSPSLITKFLEPETLSAPQYPHVSPPSRSLSTPSLQHSPQDRPSSSHSEASSQNSTSEPVSQSKTRKRKISGDQDSSDNRTDKNQPVKKTAHNMIEKRYRNNLNDKIAALRDSVPSLRVMSRTNDSKDEDETEDLEGLTPAHKLNKATVLSKATEYIRHLEKSNKRLSDEMATLRARLDTYDRLATTAPLTFNPSVTGTPGSHQFPEDAFSPKSSALSTQAPQRPPQGMIPLPESMINLHRAAMSQAHYAQQQAGYPQYSAAPDHSNAPPQPGMPAGRGYSFGNKLIVGSLAGIMILEGFSESESESEGTEARGLMALPMQLLNMPGIPASFGGPSAVYFKLAKSMLVFCAVVYLLLPLFDFKPKPKRKTIAPIRLAPAPSSASPVEVRQMAWLTAIQTVWVPQHSFFLEVAALGLKTLKLSTRKLIGWHGYALLTGITKEQELARVKAWEIALDSQLTGGDAEISMSRLVLTLVASATLPSTPERLMLKALHIRVLLWEVANAGYGAWYMFEELSAKLARGYWKAALADISVSNGLGKDGREGDAALPDHLIALLEQPCDDVLVQPIVQRAYNLAWNKPRDVSSRCVDDLMDSVIEDFSISSPLDALAAWWSSLALNKALCIFLDPSPTPTLSTSPTSSTSPSSTSSSSSIIHHLDLAIRTAPPGSTAHIRALVARTILDNHDPRASISAALSALPPSPSPFPLSTLVINAISPRPVALDVRVALTLAKCLCLAETPHSPIHHSAAADDARARAAAVVNSPLVARPDEFTLLSFVAAYTVLNAFVEDAGMLGRCRAGLERWAGALRVWVGGPSGARIGLGEGGRERVVERCIAVSRVLVGVEEEKEGVEEEIDAGYASLEEGEVPGVEAL
ncbi:hypothetical protein P152DRAFT_447478 [Eremomyces bilateralis CBS 781.70]|uniref:BHLH domain-containing protein n=1 Tax=Eremomyces bilateralis CBS 781.70 TaxID=1392243 RepID=A0A6G1GB46_9PEZI|nr:uncharacterized protein P152DRAFT_447478 [Eremomyces bilateralis CBS 781.70]KAF1815244.1 hypothetical protein P152DRAFT_447478 [Eremomyces bilateralis CBS 781.70]